MSEGPREDRPSGRSASPPTPRIRGRWAIAGLSAVQALVLIWGALSLPWNLAQVFTVFAGLTALVHVFTALVALFRVRSLGPMWRLQAYVDLALLAYLVWVVASSVSYMTAVYGGLGNGLSAALLAAFSPAVLLLLPTAIWGLAATGPWSRAETAIAVGVLFWFAVDMARWQARGRGEVLADEATVVAFAEALQRMPVATATTARAGSLMTDQAVACPEGPGLRLVATYSSVGAASVRHVCLAEADPQALVASLSQELSANARGAAVKIDLLTRTQSLDVLAPLVAPFVARPGLDGICAGSTCLMPWQLVALAQFNAFQPVKFIPDLRLGVDPTQLWTRLGGKAPDGASSPFAGLSRQATASFVRSSEGEWERLYRLRPARGPLQNKDIDAARTAADEVVRAMQTPSGRFVYRLDPFRGHADRRNFSVARQAGTTLALCELGEDPAATESAAQRSLAYLAGLVQRSRGASQVGAMVWPKGAQRREVRFGASALSLVAFLTCREEAGLVQFDGVIGALGELMLELLTPEGRFRPRFDMQAGAPVDGRFSLYADGQGVFALVLLEQLAKATPGRLPRDHEVYGAAADKALRFYADQYWQVPVRDFFFIEENWHCLAARAALPSRRVDAYERFCLDYVRFKTRLVLGPESGVAPDAVGGLHFANVTPPYNTPTAGFGEAAAAALAVAEKRGEALPEVRSALRQTLSFLVAAQWSEVSCFACAENQPVRGSFSESIASPMVRIDYVQHAWAALGHGQRFVTGARGS